MNARTMVGLAAIFGACALVLIWAASTIITNV